MSEGQLSKIGRNDKGKALLKTGSFLFFFLCKATVSEIILLLFSVLDTKFSSVSPLHVDLPCLRIRVDDIEFYVLFKCSCS